MNLWGFTWGFLGGAVYVWEYGLCLGMMDNVNGNIVLAHVL